MLFNCTLCLEFYSYKGALLKCAWLIRSKIPTKEVLIKKLVEDEMHRPLCHAHLSLWSLHDQPLIGSPCCLGEALGFNNTRGSLERSERGYRVEGRWGSPDQGHSPSPIPTQLTVSASTNRNLVLFIRDSVLFWFTTHSQIPALIVSIICGCHLQELNFIFFCSYIPGMDEKWPPLYFHFHRLFIKMLTGKSLKCAYIVSVTKGWESLEGKNNE